MKLETWLQYAVGVGVLVGYGVWIGTIEAKIDELDDSMTEAKQTTTEMRNSVMNHERRTTSRLDSVRDIVDGHASDSRRELGDLKDALHALTIEVRYRFDVSPPPEPEPPGMAQMLPGAIVPMAPPPRKASPREVDQAATKVDDLIQGIMVR